MRSQKFGIEIEMTGLTRAVAAKVIADYFETDDHSHDESARDHLGRTWKVVPDGSIQTRGGEAVELVSPICTYEDIPHIQQIIRNLKGKGAVVNKSCGIHVHIDAAPYSPDKLKNIVNIVASKENMLYKALDVSENRERDYCKRIRTSFVKDMNSKPIRSMDAVADCWYEPYSASGRNQRYHSSRYHLLNLHSVFEKGTIEFRAFNGTLHAGKIKSYIQLCLSISHQALSQKHARCEPTQSSNEKYTFRTWLLRLGMIGDEFKTARKHLLDNLAGNTAWKDPNQALLQRERLARKAEQEATESSQMETDSEEITTGFELSM